jgi:hypothetical protein
LGGVGGGAGMGSRRAVGGLEQDSDHYCLACLAVVFHQGDLCVWACCVPSICGCKSGFAGHVAGGSESVDLKKEHGWVVWVVGSFPMNESYPMALHALARMADVSQAVT